MGHRQSKHSIHVALGDNYDCTVYSDGGTKHTVACVHIDTGKTQRKVFDGTGARSRAIDYADDFARTN